MLHSNQGRHSLLWGLLAVLLIAACSSPVLPDEGQSHSALVVQGRNFNSGWEDAFFRGTANGWGTTPMELVGDNLWAITQDFAGQSNPRFKIDRYGDWGENYPSADYTVGSGEYFITFNDQTKAVSAEFVDTTPWAGVYFRGTPNGWASTSMNQVSDSIWETTQDFTGQNNPRFKIDRYGDWAENYPDGDVLIDEPGVKLIRFNTGTKVITVEDAGPNVVAAPVLSPDSGTIGESTLITASSPTSGAEIRYTLDSTDPTSSSDLFPSGGLTLTEGTYTLKARGFRSGWTDSTVTTANYTVTGAGDGVSVYVESFSGAPTIWAWIDGGSAIMELEGESWPGPNMVSEGGNWYRWDVPVAYASEIDVATPLKVILDAGSTNTLTETMWYTGGQWVTPDPRAPSAPTITISPAGGSIVNTKTVTISYQENGSPITSRTYTQNGSAQNAGSNTVTLILDASGLSEGQTITLSAAATNALGNGSAGPVTFTKINQNYTIPDTLGALYTPSETVFRIWSPDSGNVSVDVNGSNYQLSRRGNFAGYTDVYEVIVQGDLHLAEYQFRVNGNSVRDPYGMMVIPNTNTNIVMDPKSIEPDGGWAPKPVQVDREDAIIYEVHVRDFTIDGSWNGSSNNRGKFMGMVQGGTTYNGVTTGIDHLVELGVTHVQILPFYDFGTPMYNWGYDPVNYNVPEEQYSATPYDYVNRMKELMTMVNEFHKRGLRVIMDVVYNHTRGDEMFENITGQYYTGNNDSGTGNGINTGIPMVSRMIQDSLEYWIDVYNIDGYRFDLIGIFHYDEVRKWGEHINSVFPGDNILMYGEPWNGYWGDPNESAKVRYGTTRFLASGHVGVFNGAYREALKGGNDDGSRNYIFNLNEKDGKVDGGWAIFDGLRGSPYEAGGPHSDQTWGRNFAADPEQSINYISAHDNYAIWDKIVHSNSAAGDYEKRILNFGMGIILTSQGIPFLHAGDEMLRTKAPNGDWTYAHNTYNAPDEYNKIRWNWKVENSSNVDYHRDLIALRRQYEGFRMTTNAEISQYLTPEVKSPQVITGYIDHPQDDARLYIVYNSGSTTAVTLPGRYMDQGGRCQWCCKPGGA
jgi:pullulanase